MSPQRTHPVDQLTDHELRELMLRVDDTGFPGDLEELWRIESVRYRQTLRRVPPASGPDSTLLDVGSSRPWLPFWQVLLGYERIVLNTAYPESGFVDDGLGVHGAPRVDVRMSVFDAERDPFPLPDESFDVVVCLEVLEHLAFDPMAMMAEINRVLKAGGVFVVSTPNAVGVRNICRMIMGEHPMGWSAYNGFDTNRHNREYTPAEIELLLKASGMAPSEVTTFGHKPLSRKRAAFRGAARLCLWPFQFMCAMHRRNDVILASGVKTTSDVTRRPSWLYYDLGEISRPAMRPSVRDTTGWDSQGDQLQRAVNMKKTGLSASQPDAGDPRCLQEDEEGVWARSLSE